MPLSLNKKSLKALNRTIKLLRSAPRWVKGNYQETKVLKGRYTECYCVVGALRAGSSPNGNSNNYDYEVGKNLVDLASRDSAVVRFNRVSTYSGESRVTNYNDFEKRTYPQIVALLGRMKAKLEKKVNAE
jgi:predicted DNA-binding transcriptional regulator AlpA